MPKIIKIPAKKQVVKLSVNKQSNLLRVCGYARVSTDEEEQQNSYNTQVKYYTDYIKSHPNWEYVGLYSDEGITGTNTKHREGFNNMIQDAMAGKIDMIITKSVSRFARNTVDSLVNIRKLKEKGVAVFFEKENINTLDSKGEVLLTIMGSLAQEESRSISENTLWGIRKKMDDGKFSMPYSNFLGYDKGNDGKLVINKEQAKIVKLIFDLFLEGKNYNDIADTLYQRQIKTIQGKEKWGHKNIENILMNEKYIGDACLQKYYTQDYLNKKIRKNDGELPKYYIENDHEPIIDKHTFNLVQNEIKRRSVISKRLGKSAMYNPEFAGHLFCGICNTEMRRYVYHSNSKYREVVYSCPDKDSKYIKEDVLKRLITKCYNDNFVDKKETIKDLNLIYKTVGNTVTMHKELNKLDKELMAIMDKITVLVRENATTKQDQNIYKSKYADLTEKYTKTQKKYESLNNEIIDKESRAEQIKLYIENYKNNAKTARDYSPQMFMSFIEKVLVFKDKITIYWYSGNNSTIKIDENIDKNM